MKTLTMAAMIAAMSALPAFAAEHTVRMVNVGADGTRMAFEPAIVKAELGDTIVFVPEDKGHSVASLIVPDGAEAWDGTLDAETRVTLTQPGAYLFKSEPHFALGMIGMVIVGSPEPNRAAIDAFKPRGSLMRERFAALKGAL